MRVLVTAASKYGSTEEIAAAIADGLGSHGLDVTVAHVDEVEDAGGYDAVVLGSAVYAGRWMRPARSLAASLAAMPSGPPLWLFSSGPIGDPPKPEGDPSDVAALGDAPNIRGHAVFAGKLVRDELRFGDRRSSRRCTRRTATSATGARSRRSPTRSHTTWPTPERRRPVARGGGGRESNPPGSSSPPRRF